MSSTTRSYFSNGALGHFARTILHFPFSVALRCFLFSPLFGLNLFPECQHIVGKKIYTVWPRAKIEKHVLSILGEIEKERVKG